MSTKISIVTVVFNDCHHIENTIKNVISQTYDNFEYIIIDGGSTDGTYEIVTKYKESLAFYLSERDKGIYDAMNKSISHCTGDYVIFMNSGDTFASVDSIKNVFSGNINDDVVYGNAIYYYCDKPIRVIAKHYLHLKYEMPFNHQAAFVKTTLLRKWPFDSHYRYAADYDFFHNLYIQGYSFCHVDEFVSLYRLDGGVSQKNMWQCYKEVFQISQAKDFKYYCLLCHAYIASLYYRLCSQRFLNVLRRIKYR